MNNALKLHPLRSLPGLLLLALAATLLLQGCGYLAQRAQQADPVIEASSKQIVVTATMPKSVFRPGEAVLVTVTARNATDAPLSILPPTAEAGPPMTASGSLTFWFGPDGTFDRFQRFPVVSKREARARGVGGGDTVSLKAGEEIQRKFLLPGITEEHGQYVFQAHMKPYPSKEVKRFGTFYSNALHYEVYGPRLFRRDSKGLIELEEALRIAAAEAPGEIHLLDAVLIEDEMGFYRWWVNVDYEKPSGGLVQTAFLIDPYIGRVWSEAKQFESTLKRDARRVRFDQLKRMRRRALENSIQ